MFFIVEGDSPGFEDSRERLDNEHGEYIAAFRKEMAKRVIISLLPFIFCGLILLVAQNYLLPKGMIQEHHYYGPYQAITMDEINMLYTFGQLMSIMVGINFILRFAMTVETAVYSDNDKVSNFVVIAERSVNGGIVKFGPHLYEKAMVRPIQYVNHSGITFANVDQTKIHLMGKYLDKEVQYHERAIKSASSLIKGINITQQKGFPRDGEST